MIRLTRHFSMFLIILLAAGFLAATLVRLAPGFGTDERMLDPQLNAESVRALARTHAEGSNIASYYVTYLGKLVRAIWALPFLWAGPSENCSPSGYR